MSGKLHGVDVLAWWTSHVLAMPGKFSMSSLALYFDLCATTLKVRVSLACTISSYAPSYH